MIVLTTIEADRADELANRLVAERLAACVNVHRPMSSTYWWNNRIEHADECQLVIKTVAGKLPRLEARLRELHSYELPEFIVLHPHAVGPDYAAWAAAAVRD
jgi:periplasmic divalent cation tolerance protein